MSAVAVLWVDEAKIIIRLMLAWIRGEYFQVATTGLQMTDCLMLVKWRLWIIWVDRRFIIAVKAQLFLNEVTFFELERW